MFSSILRSSAALLFPNNAPLEPVSSSQVDQQLQTELEQAAEQGLVSTRSQEPTLAAGVPQSSKTLYPPVEVRDMKRKADNEGEESPAQAITKRRRRSAESNGHAASPSSATKPDQPPRWASVEAIHGDTNGTEDDNGSEYQPLVRSNPENFSDVLEVAVDQAIDGKKMDEPIQDSISKPIETILKNALSDEHSQAETNVENSKRSRKGKTPKKRSKDGEGDVGVDERKVDTNNLGKKPTRSTCKNAKATHKRFGSEDLEVSMMAPLNGDGERKGSLENISKDEGESDDEAPDTVTASAGFEKARTLVLDAAKVAARYIISRLHLWTNSKLIKNRQEASKKLKRREHDQKLSLQAKAAKVSRSKHHQSSIVPAEKRSSPDTINENGQTSVEMPKPLKQPPQLVDGEGQIPQVKARSSGKVPLPLLLPQEILEAEPIIQAPSNPSSNNKLIISQKRKLHDLEQKPPKDLKRDNAIVRVLPDTWSALPPRSSKTSKMLRESWLTGRGILRRKSSSSFVRHK